MTHIPAVDANRMLPNKPANYNAVKIQINDPKTIIPEGYEKNPNDNNIYNGVDLVINRPTVEYVTKPVYSYPQAEEPVGYGMIYSQKMLDYPILPPTYQTTNFVNNRTFINAEIEVEGADLSKKSEPELVENPQTDDKVLVREDVVLIETIPVEDVEVEELPVVPQPELTTLEEQKADAIDSSLSFHGLTFKGAKDVEIVPAVEIKPDVDVQQVVSNLASPDYDVQAQQMEDIARISMEDAQKAVPYIVTDIFNSLIEIVKKDTSNLTAPSEEQIDIRKKIIINELVREQAQAEGQDVSKIEVPYKLSEKDMETAMRLTSLEQAERNKEYGLYTMAILAKVYTDEVEKHTGNVVPLTDLPGASEIVDSLRYSQNAGVKIAALDALRYIKRPEYKDELSSLFTIVAQDSNPYVARNAMMALESLDK